MSESRRLCVVPCGSAKIWDESPNVGPTEAKNVYTGGFSKACQRYATANFEHWVILSAKYGFLFPKDIIPEPYNVSFNKPSAELVNITTLREQARARKLDAFDEIVVLGGKNYVERAKAVFTNGQVLQFPLEHCKGIGYMLQWLANATPESERVLREVSPPLRVLKEYILSNNQANLQ